MSVYHSAICFGIYASLPRIADGRLRYPNAFSRTAAWLLGLGHFLRGGYYAFEAWQPDALLDPTVANIVFFAIGTLAMPALSLGAVMLANARILTDTAYAADHDHLTGAPSRRAFFEFAERELARTGRHGGGLGLLLVDADHFKRINDTYGHSVGDEVLRDIVRRTQDVIRKVDYCARIGGEEFGILLPEANFASAEAVAGRLRAALDRSAPGAAGPHGAAYTVSVGLAMLERGESFAGLMNRADTALYAAKAEGRNRVVCAPPTAPVAKGQGGGAQVIRLRP
jgi:diguanylate cyclase (GGDEF)-like protein